MLRDIRELMHGRKYATINVGQRDTSEEESVKCSFIVLEVTQKEIMLWMNCVISYTYAVIMVIAFTLRRCHEYLADIIRRTRYSRTVQHIGPGGQNYVHGVRLLE